MKLLEQLQQVRDHVQQARGQLQRMQDPAALSRGLAQIAKDWREIIVRDWASVTLAEREEAAARLKVNVVDQLIPVASLVSMMGVPGMVAYTPCQIAGALALTHVRTSENVLKAEHLKTVARVVIWGKLGQLVWINLADLLKPVVTPPVVSLAVLPFVQGWTRAILEQVDDGFAQS